MTETVLVGTYVVYTANGETYHRKPTCATKSDVPSKFDYAASAFEKVETKRVSEVGFEKSNYCKNCCGDILKEL